MKTIAAVILAACASQGCPPQREYSITYESGEGEGKPTTVCAVGYEWDGYRGNCVKFNGPNVGVPVLVVCGVKWVEYIPKAEAR